MLKELNLYENLGTPAFFFELLNQLNNSPRKWTISNVRSYFYNRIIDNQIIFDGCLPLAQAVGVILIGKKDTITLNPAITSTLGNERHLTNKLLEMIILKLKEDETFHNIFCPENISYDIIYRLIRVEGSAFRFKYDCFRRLLLSFNFLYLHPDKNIRKYIINPKYKKLFDRELMPEIKARKIGVEQLNKMLNQKQIYGDEAEIFALKYEKKRMNSHKYFRKIELISRYDVAAGYDIISFKSLESKSPDRFIEVKSFAGTPSFHWSRNEMEVARLKKGSYFIYLIDRDKASHPLYEPTIIQDPHDQILNDDHKWVKKIDSYYVIRKVL